MKPLTTWKQGVRDVFPVLPPYLIIGIVFGALAVGKGLSPEQAIFMNAVVLAGSSQFAVIDIWADPVPVATIIVICALINVRHALMGASLAPKVAHLPRRFVLPAMFFLVDETWALWERRSESHLMTASYMAVMAGIFYLVCTGGVAIGAYFGAMIENPAIYGMDFAFVAIFIALTLGFRQRKGFAPAVVASVIVSLLTFWLVEGSLYIIAGGAAGILAAVVFGEVETRQALNVGGVGA